MVDIPRLRQRVAQARNGSLSAVSTGNYLAAALDEIEELRAEKARVQFVYDQMDGDAMEADAEIKKLRAENRSVRESFTVVVETMRERVAEIRRENDELRERLAPRETPDCPDCATQRVPGPCAADPTTTVVAGPRCYRPGYCGEPGEMRCPQVVCLIGGQPYPLWDAIQIRASVER
jgi:hypothetical protein